MGTATINLKAAASNLPDRSTKGTVMLVLDDTLEGIEKYNRKKIKVIILKNMFNEKIK